MARNYKLQWLGRSRRWRKQYKGKQYYFPLLDDETKASSYNRCLREWESQKVEIDRAAQTSTQPWLVELLTGLQESHRKRQDASRFIAASETLRLVRVAESRGLDLPIDDEGAVVAAPRLPVGVQAARDHLDTYQDELQAALRVQLGTSSHSYRPWEEEQEQQQLDRAVGSLLAQFQEANPKADRNRIKRFRSWCDENQDAGEINGAYCRRYFDFLADKQEQKEWSPAYCKSLFGVFTQFVRWLYKEVEVLEHVPRNLEDLRIEVPTKQVKVFEIGDVKRFVSAADDRMELYLLLMLNCGMTQIDIADLHPKEVTWTTGRVARKRCKTNQHENVPICTYTLWPRTLKLLKAFRSEDPERVLLTSRGEPVATRYSGTGVRNDSVHLAFQRLLTNLKLKTRPLLLFKKTSATLIEREFDLDRAQLFLGHAPRTIAEKHYIAGDDHRLDEPLLWLGKQYGLVDN